MEIVKNDENNLDEVEANMKQADMIIQVDISTRLYFNTEELLDGNKVGLKESAGEVNISYIPNGLHEMYEDKVKEYLAENPEEGFKIALGGGNVAEKIGNIAAKINKEEYTARVDKIRESIGAQLRAVQAAENGTLEQLNHVKDKIVGNLSEEEE